MILLNCYFQTYALEKKQKVMFKAIKSLCHSIQCKKCRLTCNTSCLGLLFFIMGRDFQVQSQESAGVTGKYSLFHSRQKAICIFYTVVGRIMILFTIFSTFHMKFLAKKKKTQTILSTLQTVTLKCVGHFTFQGVKSWFDSFRQSCKKWWWLCLYDKLWGHIVIHAPRMIFKRINILLFIN